MASRRELVERVQKLEADVALLRWQVDDLMKAARTTPAASRPKKS